jgi:hypothetical protein
VGLHARWRDFDAEMPEMAQILRDRLQATPLAYLATVRRDGSPRVHPVCPILTAEGMYVAIAGSGREHPSPKRFDLRRDGRFALHAMPGPRDEEFYCTGRARIVHDPEALEAIAEAAGHQVHNEDDVFELLLEYVMTAYWEHVGQPGTFAVRRIWRSASS